MDIPPWGSHGDVWMFDFIASTASSLLGLKKLLELKIRISMGPFYGRHIGFITLDQPLPTLDACLIACVQELPLLPFITIVYYPRCKVEVVRGLLAGVFDVLSERGMLRLEGGGEDDLWSVDPDANRYLLHPETASSL